MQTRSTLLKQKTLPNPVAQFDARVLRRAALGDRGAERRRAGSAV